jgi:hypothetical protein
VNGFAGPFKLEMFKKHNKSFQHKKCVMVYSALLPPKDTPLAICMKKMDKLMFDHLKILFNVAYCIAKNNKPFSNFESLLQLNSKVQAEEREEYSNKTRSSGKN